MRKSLTIDVMLHKRVAQLASLHECFITSTESGVYCFAEGTSGQTAVSVFSEVVASSVGIRLSLQSSEFVKQGPDAVALFLQKAIGLDTSMVVTENVESFRSHYEVARAAGLTGPYLSKLFQRGLWLAEKARMDMHGKRSSINADSVVLDLAEKIFGDLSQHTCLLAVSDSECESLARALVKKNIGQLLFLEKNGVAAKLAENFQGRVVTSGQLDSILPTVDILCLFDAELATRVAGLKLARVMNRRKNAPQLWVSLFDNGAPSGPLDLSRFYNVYAYQRSDLEKVVLSNLKQHQDDSRLSASYIQKEIEAFYEWVDAKEQYRFGNIIGKSESMQRILELVARIAHTDISVLIDGESGTGKELVARAIHDHSTRVAEPFVVVNCGAIPENLLESELFGHVRGAFTGASSTKVGLIEAAHQGTIFLDEIGETSLATQVKLLRFLQEGEIKPVGSNETKQLNVRVITATNRNLEEMVERDLFRQDLYYRLNVIQITLPPLRDRREDIMPLVSHFLKKYAELTHKFVVGVDEEVQHLFSHYDWPGNVRELENAIERAVALSSSSLLTQYDVPPRLREPERCVRPNHTAGTMSLKEVEKLHITAMLEKHDWNYDLVTKILGIGRTTLWRKMKEYQISN